MTDRTTNRLYTATSIILPILGILILALASCSGPSLAAQCQARAAKFPAGMVATWKVDHGHCLVQVNRPGAQDNWFDAESLISFVK